MTSTFASEHKTMQKMKKQIITLLLVALVGFTFADNDGTAKKTTSAKTPAQTISITGNVNDFNSGESLAGVEVKIEGTDLKTYTDFDGNFSFENIKPGTYNIIASYISYNKSLIENFNVKKENKKLSIKLQASK